jgi:hypothetical protein
MSSSVVRLFLGVLCALVVSHGSAYAQVCGDADGNGQVSVTDGVAALRAAANLPNTCGGGRCDVDGNGTITVTDGVNVLRKAAALPITENCPGSSVDQQVEELLQNTLPIFGQLTKVGGAAAARIAETFACDNQDGFFEIDDETLEIEFVNCQLDVFVYDGFLTPDESGTLFFDLSFTDLTTDEFFSFFGDLSFRSTQTGGIIAGSLDVSFEDLGEISVVFEEVETDFDENFVGGSVLFDASNSDIEGVVGIRVGFTTDVVVPVSVIFDDESVLVFDFDTISGELTPVSN